ncbi:hypothetical protein L7F22_049678 [Adiantum nelumboides]|nr:hypothetical protein [Adiantum nelumboides]
MTCLQIEVVTQNTNGFLANKEIEFVKEKGLGDDLVMAHQPQHLPKQNIRIQMKSYWIDRIEEATKLILNAACSTETKIMGLVPLLTRRRVYCMLRSPHVNKDSRDHFDICTHQCLIELENPWSQRSRHLLSKKPVPEDLNKVWLVDLLLYGQHRI